MVELYRLTQFRKKQLQAFYPDFETVEIWEHECKDMWKTLDPEIKEKKTWLIRNLWILDKVCTEGGPKLPRTDKSSDTWTLQGNK